MRYFGRSANDIGCLQGIETLWEDIVANDPEWNAKLVLVPGLTDAWSGELKETFAKATEEFVVPSELSVPDPVHDWGCLEALLQNAYRYSKSSCAWNAFMLGKQNSSGLPSMHSA